MKKTLSVQVGKVYIGGDHPIVIQSMTNTATDDVQATVEQIKELADAASELVRLTVNTPGAAKAIPEIKKKLMELGYGELPLVGDFHYNGHLLLERFPECARTLDKYRINPGNVGIGDLRAEHFAQIIKIALVNHKPVRIGVNWGSLDQDVLTKLMDKNAQAKKPKSDKEVIIAAMIKSAIDSADLAEKLGMSPNKIILSVKMSEVQDMVKAYQLLHEACHKKGTPYPLHLGLTEAGLGMKGIVASSAALAILLQQGIGNTIRISLTPSPDGKRSDEVEACKLLLQTMGIRAFKPMVTSCPGCGRTSNDLYQRMAKEISEYIDQRLPVWKKKHPGVEEMKVAVMGCVVNGPGESQHADIGISLPGKSEKPLAQVYIGGKPIHSLKGNEIVAEFKALLEKHVESKYSGAES
jgi:(E)-4-hydroxy-3-methylbut-2-enyl-diphosphate synthase